MRGQTVPTPPLTCSRQGKIRFERVRKIRFHFHFSGSEAEPFFFKLMAHSEMSVVTVSVIAKCAFGMTIDNLGAKGNLFIQKAQTVFAPPENKSPLIMLLCKSDSFIQFRLFIGKEIHDLWSMIAVVLPNFVMKWLGTYLLNLEHWYFFIDIMKNMVEERSKTTEVRIARHAFEIKC